MTKQNEVSTEVRVETVKPEQHFQQGAAEIKTNPELYKGASLLEITENQKEILEAPVDNTEVEVRPDGLIYLPQVFTRERLNKAFGPGKWCLIQNNVYIVEAGGKQTLCFDGSLYIKGHFVARSMGEADYIKNNPNYTWGTVYESAKSDCITRVAKDLGVAKELWKPIFIREWLKNNSIKVWRNKAKDYNGNKTGAFAWRRKDVDPFYDEGKKAADQSDSERGPSRQSGPAAQSSAGSSQQSGGSGNGSRKPFPRTKCPKCGKVAVMKSIRGDGYYCNPKQEGCKATFDTLPNPDAPKGPKGGQSSSAAPNESSAPLPNDNDAPGTGGDSPPRPTPDLRSQREKNISFISWAYEQTKAKLFITSKSKAILYYVSETLRKAVISLDTLSDAELTKLVKGLKGKHDLEACLEKYRSVYEDGGKQ